MLRTRPCRVGLLSGLLGLGFLAASAAGPARPEPSRSPEASPAGLVLASPCLDLGCVELGAPVAGAVAWRRIGAGPLRRLAVDAGCACTAVEGVPPRLVEGARGHLRVRLRPRRATGPVRIRVRLYLDAPPPGDVVTLEVLVRVVDPAAREGPAEARAPSPVPASSPPWIPGPSRPEAARPLPSGTAATAGSPPR